RLLLHTMATGASELIAHVHGHHDTCAAFAPDGRTIAALARHEDQAVLCTVDLTTGSRRPLWSRAGAASADPVVTWSPDGRFIAATYLTAEDDFATIVARS